MIRNHGGSTLTLYRDRGVVAPVKSEKVDRDGRRGLLLSKRRKKKTIITTTTMNYHNDNNYYYHYLLLSFLLFITVRRRFRGYGTCDNRKRKVHRYNIIKYIILQA